MEDVAAEFAGSDGRSWLTGQLEGLGAYVIANNALPSTDTTKAFGSAAVQLQSVPSVGSVIVSITPQAQNQPGVSGSGNPPAASSASTRGGSSPPGSAGQGSPPGNSATTSPTGRPTTSSTAATVGTPTPVSPPSSSPAPPPTTQPPLPEVQGCSFDTASMKPTYRIWTTCDYGQSHYSAGFAQSDASVFDPSWTSWGPENAIGTGSYYTGSGQGPNGSNGEQWGMDIELSEPEWVTVPQGNYNTTMVYIFTKMVLTCDSSVPAPANYSDSPSGCSNMSYSLPIPSGQ